VYIFCCTVYFRRDIKFKEKKPECVNSYEEQEQDVFIYLQIFYLKKPHLKQQQQQQQQQHTTLFFTAKTETRLRPVVESWNKKMI
jgi:hypothetical protein